MTFSTTKGVAMKTTTELPVPSKTHATCAWCRECFETITALIDHVDAGHTDPATVRFAA